MDNANPLQIRTEVKKARGPILKACTDYTISEQQNRTLNEPPSPPSLCVSRSQLPAPLDESDDSRNLLRDAIISLGTAQYDAHVPSTRHVPVEWSSYRPGPAIDPRETMTKSERYNFLTTACKDDMTIMFIHGGIL